MLGDFAAHGAVLRRYDRRADKLTAEQSELITQFQAGLRTDGRAVSTVRTYGTLAGEFLAFVDTRSRLADCDARTVEAFIATLSGYQAKTVEQKLCAVRSFLRFSALQGQVDADVLKAVPTVKSSKQARVPSVWPAMACPYPTTCCSEPFPGG
ncbi:site-specific integrase [Achromobacter aegrifaciens]